MAALRYPDAETCMKNYVIKVLLDEVAHMLTLQEWTVSSLAQVST